MNIYNQKWSPSKEVTFSIAQFIENAFIKNIHKYSKNFNKMVVKNNFSSYNNFNVRKRNMKIGGEIT